MRQAKGLFDFAASVDPPLELHIVGRTLFHAAMVGLFAGLLGCLFLVSCEFVAKFFLENGAGYHPLRAASEEVLGAAQQPHVRWWLLALIPAAGGLIAGLISLYAPETRGGGGDAAIDGFHQHNGNLRVRGIWTKLLASVATLGSGGSGGREGPTMFMGAALGSAVGKYLRTTQRERRVLMVAGIAAGISAVFRTPLGAALLAIEMLYRDDFEAEALIPAVLASVVAYSVAISVFGPTSLFGRLPAFPFDPRHLLWFALLAVFVSAVASMFVGSLRLSHKLSNALPFPVWLRPAVGGLVLGLFAVVAIHYGGSLLGRSDEGLGILGGGYGAAQIAITGSEWMPLGWHAVELLMLLAVAKLIATSLTIGTGGSAGDFAPALAIGALVGGAFGLAIKLLTHDDSIVPGAFALVGMGTFYGGIAKTPLASLVLVCEMAGSYDLLVPLMLGQGIAFVALRKVSLYQAQVPTQRESPVHRKDHQALLDLSCIEVMPPGRSCAHIAQTATLSQLEVLVEELTTQDVLPVIDATGKVCGLITRSLMHAALQEADDAEALIIADVMAPVVAVTPNDLLGVAIERMLHHKLRALAVIDQHGRFIDMIDEHDISAALMQLNQPISDQH